MSAPLVMVAVTTTVTTLLAPTTAIVELGTHWMVMVATVMVRIITSCQQSLKQSFGCAKMLQQFQLLLRYSVLD